MDPLDLRLCQASLAAYTAAPFLLAGGDVHAVVSEEDDMTIVAFRGTVPSVWEDWFRDFAAWPEHVVNHPRLGFCHHGFVSGAEAILPQLATVLTASRPFALTGHSLGGALAIAAGAILADSSLIATRLTTFGAPRLGMALRELLAPVSGSRYRYGNDPVPEVPSWPYVNDRPWTHIGAPAFDPIEDHAIAGYLAALTGPAPA